MNIPKFSVHTLMCLLACATTACSNELEQKEIPAQGEGEGERITVTATAGMPQGEPSTRVEFTEDDGANKLKLSWRPIDDPKGPETFSVFSGTASTNTAEPAGSTTLSTFTMQSLEEGDNATFTGEIIVNPGTTYYAVYPALTADANAPATDVAATAADASADADAAVSPTAVSPTAIPLDMTGQKGDDYDESKTYMYSSCTYATTDKLKFNFKPLTSILEVTLQFPTLADGSTVEYVRFSATDGLYKSANVDITKSSATYNDQKAGYLELSNSFTLSGKETKVYLHLLPGTLKNFEVSAVVNSTIYIGTISASTEIVAGKMYTNTVEMQPYTLDDAKIGDFYCVKNGNGYLIPGDVTPNDDQKKECIGIVFGVGNKALGEDPLLKRDHANCSHGLVVALQDATLGDGSNGMYWSKDYESVQNTWVTLSDEYKSVVNLEATDKLCGYSNTLALMAYNEEVKKNSRDGYRVLPCDAIQNYSDKKLAPKNSSGWYFPSVMELKYVCWGWGEISQSAGGKKKLNEQIEKVSGSSVFGSAYYWSSTEDSYDSYYAWRVYFVNGSVHYNGKYSNVYRVRPLLAF